MPHKAWVDSMTDLTAGTDLKANDSSAETAGGDPAAVALLTEVERTGQLTQWKGVLRLLQTVRHLKARQALYLALRRGFGRRFDVPVPTDVQVRTTSRMKAELASPSAHFGMNEFAFLNVRRRFDGGIDWQGAAESKLWQYNLHYFDYALEGGRTQDWVRATMADWVRCNPPAKSVGWEPYPISLRVVNWIKFDLRKSAGDRLPPSCRRSLYQQLWWLDGNLEHEIQANHLLKNAKALLFGGAYFSGRVADRWLRKGRELFIEQLEDQIQSDGGHHERSAMYHAIALHDMLDVLSLAIGSADVIPDSAVAKLTQQAESALAYLEDLTFPGGRLPLFNDSVAGIAPRVDALRAYARAISPLLDTRAPPAVALISKTDTGFYGYRSDAEMLLIDGGGPSPSYQPGHSHCGLLGFELVIAGRPVIVDSGVHDYDNTPLRHLLRSTAAHNTVRIDREEQSDIWSAFRMGRRAHAGSTALAADLPYRFQYSGSHDGYRHLAGRPVHRRVIDCNIGQCWQIVDEVSGRGTHVLESFLHFHPSYRLDGQGHDWFATCEESRMRFRIRSTGGECERRPSIYCPGFGLRQTNWMLALRAHSPLPAELTYVIERL